MIELMKQLTILFKSITPEAYHEWNAAKSVTYPYITFSVDGEYLERMRDGFTIDVDIFDNNSSYAEIFELEQQLKNTFRFKRLITDDFFIMFEYQRSTTVSTGDETIKRRNLIFYAQVDWRK